jgi:hypothetical protein
MAGAIETETLLAPTVAATKKERQSAKAMSREDVIAQSRRSNGGFSAIESSRAMPVRGYDAPVYERKPFVRQFRSPTE